VQVDGDHPMAIKLKLKRSSSGFAGLAILLCLLTGAMAVTRRGKNRPFTND
jgi:hypothetical protein